MTRVSQDLRSALRTAVESGDWERLRPRFAAYAVLDTSSEAGRRQVHGADAIVAHLSVPGPGKIHLWHADEWPAGVALSFEWEGANDRDRRRWYVRTNANGAVTEIWSTAARPAEVVAAATSPPPSLLEGLGATRVEPLSHGGNSGAALVRAFRDDGTAFVLKRVGAAGADWLARATHDEGRTAKLYRAGAFDRMPPAIGHGIVAVKHSDDAAWIAMRDVQAQLLPATAYLSRDASRGILAAAAELHRTFHDDVPPGAATLADRIGMSSPGVADAERHESDLLPKQFEQGWDAFGELTPDDVSDAVLDLTRRPDALADALLEAHGGHTLIHGDLRGDNLGFDGDRLVLIDWDLATAGTPTVEFAWYLAHSARRIDAGHDEIEADYRSAEGDGLSDDEVELAMLSGLVQYGWRIAHSARVHPDPAETEWGRRELDWWVPRARTALNRLGGAP
jgi:aminoglycoside phosphotransferase (APT) family kinase protein